jgi:23S rRNA pseudouridine1911/1915/1917 synthase
LTLLLNTAWTVKKRGLQPEIVFQGNSFLVLDKPAGLVVNRAKTVKSPTVQDWIEKNLEFGTWNLEIPSDFIRRSGIVHRLDKETSGLLLVAKTKKSFENLQHQFKKREVKKKYLALVHGRLEPKTGEVVLPLGRTKKDREKFGVVVGGRKARTKYRVKKYCQTEDEQFSFLELELLTGRTHQLRVHLSFLGYPIVADLKYGGKRGKANGLICPRLFLHAQYLAFNHPATGQFCEFASPLPSQLENVILKICEKSPS